MAATDYTPEQVHVKLAEYAAAQEMLRHYDTLNWQIGSILIGANAVLFGFAAAILGRVGWLGLLVAAAVASFSAFLLYTWWLWFDRHRALYNFRHETMHRIELQLGMYHHLRVVEAGGGGPTAALEQLAPARTRAENMPGGGAYTPFYDAPLLEKKMPGYRIAQTMWWKMPLLEFAALALVVVAERA